VNDFFLDLSKRLIDIFFCDLKVLKNLILQLSKFIWMELVSYYRCRLFI